MSEFLNLNRLIFFSATIEAGSFTAAADRLGVAKAVVSHQIAKLEEELGITLLTRTTRRLHATEEGRLFYQHCVLILRQAELAYGEVSSHKAEPAGTLTLTAPLDYGASVVAPTIANYLKAYPQMRVDVIFDDSVSDIIADGIDLSIRVGWLKDSSHQTRRLGTFQQIVVATPQIAACLADDSGPGDATQLPWIANRVLKNAARLTFFSASAENLTVDMQSVITTDKTPSAYACMLAGIGASVFPDYMVEADLKAGKIVRLFPQWSLPEGGIHAVFPPARFQPAKVRSFLSMLIVAERGRSTTSKPLGTGG